MNDKKGTFRCLFFALIYAFVSVFGSLLYASPATKKSTQYPCPAQHIDQQANIKYVHDGDTIILENGDKIRLIGINTPELARKHKNKPNELAEPYADTARDYLRKLLNKDRRIQLQFGVDKKDRYGRMLAHVFLSSGENVQSKLLEQGLASTIVIPPNHSFASCYQKIEQQARCQKIALWSELDSILQSTQLTKHNKGFHLIQGKVTNINTNRRGIWIHLSDKLTLGIRSENQHLFNATRIASLAGKTLLVRGWLNKGPNNRPYIRIRHPLSLEAVNNEQCLAL